MHRTRAPYIIDVEASGLGADSYPIEVGVALANGDKLCSLIQPIPEWTHWDKNAEQVHGISREMLQSCGNPVHVVADMLNDKLAGMTLYSDGWVVDKPWLTNLFHAARRQMYFSVSPLELILSEAQMAAWHATKDSIIAETQLERHRASNDAWIIQETYRRTLEPPNSPARIVHAG